jgi:hypothetical protein
MHCQVLHTLSERITNFSKEIRHHIETCQDMLQNGIVFCGAVDGCGTNTLTPGPERRFHLICIRSSIRNFHPTVDIPYESVLIIAVPDLRFGTFKVSDVKAELTVNGVKHVTIIH